MEKSSLFFRMDFSGKKNWSNAETTYLLDFIEERNALTWSGTNVWELISADLMEVGGYNRTGEACRNKFDKLWKTEKPTGSADPPVLVARAIRIKEQLEAFEVMGKSSFNSDSFDFADEDNEEDIKLVALEGTNLMSE